MKPIYTCPHCHADLTGELIPVERRQLFNGAERYSRERLEFMRGFENYAYICPECGTVTRRE